MLWERQSSWRDDREARIKELEERLARLEEHNKPSPVVEHLKPGNELVIYSQVIAGVVNALWLYFFGGDLPPEWPAASRC